VSVALLLLPDFVLIAGGALLRLPQPVAPLISTGTLLAALTLPLWIALVSRPPRADGATCGSD